MVICFSTQTVFWRLDSRTQLGNIEDLGQNIQAKISQSQSISGGHGVDVASQGT